jgi:DNA-binding CsgD family transcriptional regulator
MLLENCDAAARVIEDHPGNRSAGVRHDRAACQANDCGAVAAPRQGWLARLFPDAPQVLQILDTVSDGIVVLDEWQQVQFINDFARALIAESGQLRIEETRLEGAFPEPRKALREFLSHCARAEAAGQCLCLGRSAQGGIWLRLLCRMPGRNGDPTLSVLALGGPLGGIRLKGKALRQFFAMTEAETLVAMALAAGRSPAWIARERGVSINTVRTQVRAILCKARAERIADLVRIVATMPNLAGEHEP